MFNRSCHQDQSISIEKHMRSTTAALSTGNFVTAGQTYWCCGRRDRTQRWRQGGWQCLRWGWGGSSQPAAPCQAWPAGPSLDQQCTSESIACLFPGFNLEYVWHGSRLPIAPWSFVASDDTHQRSITRSLPQPNLALTLKLKFPKEDQKIINRVKNHNVRIICTACPQPQLSYNLFRKGKFFKQNRRNRKNRREKRRSGDIPMQSRCQQPRFAFSILQQFLPDRPEPNLPHT